MDDLENHLAKVTAYIKEPSHQYTSLRPKTEPIPFFGDIKNATVLTVGVNPSSTAFNKSIGSPDEIDKITANNPIIRLQNYFALYSHEWLDFWELALKPLGASYQPGSAHLAAHLDLSPRVTASMGGANRVTFLAMMKEDAKWFFRLLPQCKAVQLVLIAGTVASRYYMDEFVECVANRYGYKLQGPPTSREKGFSFNRLRGSGIDLPVFFCSVSPSNKRLDENKIQRRQKLPKRIEEHKEKLLELLNEQPASART